MFTIGGGGGSQEKLVHSVMIVDSFYDLVFFLFFFSLSVFCVMGV